MTEWLINTAAGKFITTMVISMIPVIELRGGIPYGAAMGLDYITAFLASVIGNLIPAPFIILFIRQIFSIMKQRGPRFRALAEKYEAKAHLKSAKVIKYGTLGLFILVAIPLPGTGAWTGSLVAALLNLRLKRALPAITAGVITAGIIVTAITAGVIHFV